MWDPEYPTLVYRNEWTTRLVLPQLQFIHEAVTFKDSANQRNLSRSLYGNKTTDSIIVLYVLLCWPRTVWFLGTDLLAMRHLCVLASILVQVKLSACPKNSSPRVLGSHHVTSYQVWKGFSFIVIELGIISFWGINHRYSYHLSRKIVPRFFDNWLRGCCFVKF